MEPGSRYLLRLTSNVFINNIFTTARVT
jgi:hypothetical protein